jgi:hypothetical protein
VARNRARRYAGRHRRAKPFLPLISTAIFASLLFERWPEVFSFARVQAPGSSKARPPFVPDGDQGRDGAGQVWVDEDEGRPRYQPPPDFLARDVAQVVAFLVRNRGRAHTEAVRAKWDFLDKMSLPLAVYLREVEATGAWNDLEKDIKVAPLAVPRVAGVAMPKSLWHRKVLATLPDWAARGEDLIRTAQAEIFPPEPAPPGQEDGPDTDTPRP